MIRNLLAVLTVSAATLVLGTPALAAGPSLGYYRCYQTLQTRNALTDVPNGYVSKFATSFTLKPRHNYQVSLLTAGVNGFGQRFAVKGHTLRFVNGVWNDSTTFRHLTGTVYPHGVRMRNAQTPLNPAQKYSVVLRGRSGDTDSAPPAREYTGLVPRSFWYCTTSKPKLVQPGPAPAPSPSPAPTPTPTPVPSSAAHPPYGISSCRDKNNAYTNTFTLTDPFLYNEANSSPGSFTFDQPSGRIDFQGGKYDSTATGWHLYGVYQAAGTIVLASTSQTAAGGPDADEIGAHTFWRCSPI
jgi:hypothetical protein